MSLRRSCSAVPGGRVGELVSMQCVLWHRRVYKKSTGSETPPPGWSTLPLSDWDQVVWWTHSLSPKVLQLVTLHWHCILTEKHVFSIPPKTLSNHRVRLERTGFLSAGCEQEQANVWCFDSTVVSLLVTCDGSGRRGHEAALDRNYCCLLKQCLTLNCQTYS